MRILDRYILRELTVPFLLGLAVFTSILLIARILKLVEMVVNKGVPFLQMLELFSYILPAFLEVTVPMALLLAVLVALGRLSTDSEIIALQASGVGPSRLSVPVALFATVIALLTLFLSLSVRPWGNGQLRTGLYEIVKSRASAGIRAKVFNDEFKGLVIYVDAIDPPGDVLKGVVISDTREEDEQNTVFARTGSVITSEEAESLTLRLVDGNVYTSSKSRRSYQDTRFSTYDINLDLNAILDTAKKRERDIDEVSLRELRVMIAEKEAKGESANVERSELHRKFAIPFACFVFAALGVPLGVRPARAVRSWGFAVSLGLIFVYYILLTLGQSLGERGTVPAAIALWLPNVLLSITALALLKAQGGNLAPSGESSNLVNRIRSGLRGPLDRIRAGFRKDREG